MSRVEEKLILGAIVKAAVAGIANTKFYVPEQEPAVTSTYKMVMIDIEMDDQAMRSDEWMGQGVVKAFIRCRLDTGSGVNVYSSKTMAHDLSTLFVRKTIDVVDNASATVGYIRITEAISRPMGEADGIIEHYWQAPFFVNSV